MGKTDPKRVARQKRKKRSRSRVRGTPERPRLCVYRSNKHIYAQIIDDTIGHTLAAASTLSKEKERAGSPEKTTHREAARWVGALVARKALERNIKKVVFDRNGFLYHGRVRALAEAAREEGLDF